MHSSTLDDLLEAYTQVGIRNSAILDEFALIAEQFHQHAIPFIVLKGADVISRLYGVRGARPISDVDVLVHESDLAAIDQLLRHLGFTQQIDGNPAYASSKWSLSLDFITSVWYLDAHELTALWNRAPSRIFGTTTISCLDTADLLIYLTAYNVIHRGHLSASLVHDIKLLITKEQPDWDVVVARTMQSRLQVALFHGLSHVRTILPSLSIPDRVLARFAPATRRERRLAWLLRKLVTTEPLPEVGHLLLFLTQPGLNKVMWLQQRLYPSTAFLAHRYGLLGRMKPWKTRLSRLYHLTLAGVFLSGRVLKRLTAAPAGPLS